MLQGPTQGQAPPRPHAVDGVYEVPDHSAPRVVNDRVRNNLLSVRIQSADRYNDQSRNIVQQCIHLLPLADKQNVQRGLREVDALADRLEKKNNWFRNILLIREYRRVSKETYFLVKRASNRLIHNQIDSQIMAQTGPQAPPPSVLNPTAVVAEPLSIANNSNISSGACWGSALDSASFCDVERVDLTTLQSNETGDSAVLLELHTREQRTRDYVATLQATPQDVERLAVDTWDPAEVGTAHGSVSLGPPSDIVVDA